MGTTVRKQTEIQAAAIFRAMDKSGKCLGYLVPSDSQEGVCYQVTWNALKHEYQCDCPARCECKHIRAVKQVCAIRKVAQGMAMFAEALVAYEQAESAKSEQEYQEMGYLISSYDVVGEALKVANQAEADAKIGDFYAVVGDPRGHGSCQYCGRLAKKDVCPACAGC